MSTDTDNIDLVVTESCTHDQFLTNYEEGDRKTVSSFIVSHLKICEKLSYDKAVSFISGALNITPKHSGEPDAITKNRILFSNDCLSPYFYGVLERIGFTLVLDEKEAGFKPPTNTLSRHEQAYNVSGAILSEFQQRIEKVQRLQSDDESKTASSKMELSEAYDQLASYVLRVTPVRAGSDISKIIHFLIFQYIQGKCGIISKSQIHTQFEWTYNFKIASLNLQGTFIDDSIILNAVRWIGESILNCIPKKLHFKLVPYGPSEATISKIVYQRFHPANEKKITKVIKVSMSCPQVCNKDQWSRYLSENKEFVNCVTEFRHRKKAIIESHPLSFQLTAEDLNDISNLYHLYLGERRLAISHCRKEQR